MNLACFPKMSKIIGLCSLLLISLQTHAQPTLNELSELPSGNYKVDLSHASVIWKVSHMGLSGYVGRFENFDASIDLDTSDISNSSVNVQIITDSVDTAYPNPEQTDFNAKVAGDVLKSAEFPNIEFQSTSVSALDGNSFTIDGILSLAGQDKAVRLDAVLNGAMLKRPFSGKPIVGFSAITSFKRSEWGLGIYVPTIGDEVTVSIEGEFILED